jgi:hypothetical protein
MEVETGEISHNADMPEEIAEAWANALIDLHSKVVKQADMHFNQMEETETCESNSDAHPC